MGEETRQDAALLTSELVTNAVRHTKCDKTLGQRITVTILRTTNTIRVEVADQDSRPLPPLSDPVNACESGRGLDLVARLANHWGTSFPATGGKVVWFEILSHVR